jgi:hypothetical protein
MKTNFPHNTEPLRLQRLAVASGATSVILQKPTAVCRAFALLALAVTVMFVAGGGVKAQVAALEGETFQAASQPEKMTCDPNAGQLTFEVRGTATGPYKGEFFETGTLTFDPKTGQITGGHIEFTVYTTTQKTVVGVKAPKEGIVRCSVDPNTGISSFSVSVPILSYTADLLVEMTKDEGQATLDFSGSSDTSTKPPTSSIQFTEIFHSSNFASTPGKVTGGGTIVPLDSKNGITFGFNAQNTDQGMKGAGTIIDHNAGVKVKILDVATFAVIGTKATFSGRAEVNGVEEKYRIDVDDVGEPGGGLDSFKIVTDSYVGGGTLTGGNIQVHK